MSILDVVQKLEDSNKENKSNLEQLHEQFDDLRTDPRFKNLPMEELENLFLEYLRVWIKTNTEIIELLTDKKTNQK